MANQSLPDLTERTATANSDLIHVNSGGTDYKETKGNFLSDVNSSITSLNNSLTKSLTCDLIFDNKSIPSTATSYDCNWQDYHFILICTMFYGNVRSTYLIPYAIMYGSTSNSRPQAWDPYSNIRYDIYANGSGHVYALTAQGTSDSALGLRIYGVYKR